MAIKKKADGGGLGPHVRALRAGRTDFPADVLKVFMQFLFMLNTRYTEAAASAAGRHDGVNSSIKDGIRRRFNQLADAALVFAQDAAAPWSRVQWHRAGALLEEWLARAAVAGDLADIAKPADPK